MRLLIAPAENFIFGEKTFFNEDLEYGLTVLTVKNAGNFKANSFVVLGTIGTEKAEIRQIATISADLKTITLAAATRFNRNKLEPIQEIRFNKRKFYRSDEKDSGYVHLSTEGSPIEIQVDVPEGTRLEDSSGTDSHYYKATYFNSYTSEETSLDDAIPSKASDSDHYSSIYRIRSEAGLLENDFITSDIINSYRLEAESQVEGALVSIYQLPFATVPKLVQHIVALLAAGFLLSKEYGMEADIEIAKTGQRKIERAEELLQKIINGEIALVNIDGDLLQRRSSYLASNSNRYNSDKFNKGELFTLEDEAFRFADPETGKGSTKRSLLNENRSG